VIMVFDAFARRVQSDACEIGLCWNYNVVCRSYR